MNLPFLDERELEGGEVFVFLDVDNPIVAWAAARGVLVSARHIANNVDDQAVPVSLMMSALLEWEPNPRYVNEMIIEEGRKQYGPPDTSARLWGMFCLTNLNEAKRVASDHGWGGHFRAENLVSATIDGVGKSRTFDSNWITYAPVKPNGVLDRTKLDWLQEYWSGRPCPGHDPIRETVIDGKIFILGTRVRKKAYDLAAETFPTSKALLEFGRIAAWNGYDLGAISPFLFDEGDRWACRY